MVDTFQITLKAARINAGLRITEAAEQIGISVPTLIKWEKNPGMVTADQQRLLSAVYNCPLQHMSFS